MLKLQTSSLCIEPNDLMELERIVMDDDSEGAENMEQTHDYRENSSWKTKNFVVGYIEETGGES